MPDVTCVKSGGLDGSAADHPIAVEFYCKDRLVWVFSYLQFVSGRVFAAFF